MSNARAGLLALVSAIFLLAAAPAFGLIDAGALKNAQVVTKDLFINGNGDNTAGASVKCPHGTRALTGGSFPASDLVSFLTEGRVSDSAPTADGKGWYADAASLNGGGLTVTEDVRCLAKHRLADAKLRTKDFDAASNSGDGGSVKCPHGTRVLTGGAFWQPGHQGPDSTLANLVALWSSSPTHDGKRWFAAGYNGSASNLNLTVVVRCLAKEKLAHVEVVSIPNGVSNGVGNAGLDPCPGGTRALTGGVFWHQFGDNEQPDPSIARDANLLWSTPTLDDRSLDTGWSNHSGGNEKFLTKEIHCLGG